MCYLLSRGRAAARVRSCSYRLLLCDGTDRYPRRRPGPECPECTGLAHPQCVQRVDARLQGLHLPLHFMRQIADGHVKFAAEDRERRVANLPRDSLELVEPHAHRRERTPEDLRIRL